jgi:hypothetical protein
MASCHSFRFVFVIADHGSRFGGGGEHHCPYYVRNVRGKICREAAIFLIFDWKRHRRGRRPEFSWGGSVALCCVSLLCNGVTKRVPAVTKHEIFHFFLWAGHLRQREGKQSPPIRITRQTSSPARQARNSDIGPRFANGYKSLQEGTERTEGNGAKSSGPVP